MTIDLDIVLQATQPMQLMLKIDSTAYTVHRLKIADAEKLDNLPTDDAELRTFLLSLFEGDAPACVRRIGEEMSIDERAENNTRVAQLVSAIVDHYVQQYSPAARMAKARELVRQQISDQAKAAAESQQERRQL